MPLFIACGNPRGKLDQLAKKLKLLGEGKRMFYISSMPNLPIASLWDICYFRNEI